MRTYNQFLLEKFKENEKNTPVLYKDDNLEVKVVKTLDAAKEQGKDTNWCSNDKYGFYKHNITANMFRFNWKDGYKLRLTWDYIPVEAARDKYAGGTHWGQGGVVKGEQQWYNTIRPKDENHPFNFDYHREDDRAKMVKKIQSIPEKAQLACYQYQEEHQQDKNALVTQMYSELKKIKIMNVENVNDKSKSYYNLILDIEVMYRKKQYFIHFRLSKYGQPYFHTDNLDDALKNKYLIVEVGRDAINHYLWGEMMKWLKQNNKKDIVSLVKKDYSKEIENESEEEETY